MCKDREEMTFAAEALLDLSTSSASMPPTNDASTQTDLAYTDIECLVAECNKAKANKLQLSKVVDDLESELHQRKSNLRLIQGSDVKTRFLYWATYLCCFHGTSQVYRAIHYSGLLTSQQF